MITTTRGGPPIQDVHRRIVRSLSTGKVIDDCIVDDTTDSVLNRHLRVPEDIRIELIMKGALKMFETKGVDVAELYSQPRIAQEAAIRSYNGVNLLPGWSLDLTREDPLTGEPWDMAKHEVRERVRKLVRDTKPFMVIGSPPCTMFCSLQDLNKGKRDEEEFQRKLEVAKKHVRFCLELYQLQVDEGRFFLHEHPNSSTSWSMPEVIKMIALEGVDTTVCDMCAYGLEAEDKLAAEGDGVQPPATEDPEEATEPDATEEPVFESAFRATSRSFAATALPRAVSMRVSLEVTW